MNLALMILDSLTTSSKHTILSQLKVDSLLLKYLSNRIFLVLSELPGIEAKARMNYITYCKGK